MVAVAIQGEDLTVFVVVSGFFEDLLALIPAGDHMVERAGKFDAGFPWHAAMLVRER